jgi:hypothetical protein
VSDAPVVNRLARAQAVHVDRVTSLRHRPVDLDDDKIKVILPLLDGTKTRSDLLAIPGTEITEADLDAALSRLLELCLLEK